MILKKQLVSFRLRPELLARLIEQANIEGISRAAIVSRVLHNHLRRRQRRISNPATSIESQSTTVPAVESL
jgi:hypothetical protein